MGEIMENLTLTAALAKALGGGGGGGSGGVSDVLLNGQSIVNAQGEANVPIAKATLGVVLVDGLGLAVNQTTGRLQISAAAFAAIKGGEASYAPICPAEQQHAVFYGLAKIAGADEKNSSLTVGTYTETAKSAISQMLNAPETVSGSTPSITAKPGVQYICGEVSTIDITVPESGIIDVIFESGSTPAVLTVTPPTGMTMKWAGGFDPTNLEANTTYEINIMNGCLGVGAAWT